MKEVIIRNSRNSQISISPEKLNIFVSLIRKKDLRYSLELSEFSGTKAARIIHKLLKGAAKKIENEKENLDNFFIEKAEVNRGTMQRNVIFRAKGRSDRISRRYSLLNILITKKNGAEI